MDQTAAPLDGVRVLDIATFVAAPFAAACLAEFGADVIKVEKPGVGDSLRQLGTESDTGDTYWWLNDARNKRCITLDLKHPKGAEMFKRLAADSDVVMENFRPGTLERWGLGFETLRELNPGLVMLRVSAYGQQGPKRDLPGFARIAQAYAGLSYLTGQPDTPPLIAGSTTLADYLSGLYGAYGVLLALRAREKSGRGQYIDIGLHDGIFRFLDELAAVYSKTGYVRERHGTETDSSVPHSHYATGDGKWVAVACTNDKMFQRFVEVIGNLELADEKRFGSRKKRVAEREVINRLVTEWTMSLPRDEVIARCCEGDVPCGPINSIADIFEDEQFKVRDTLVRVKDDRVGELAVQGVVPKLSETPGKIKHLGPDLGAHNREIYMDRLGLSEEEIAALREEGVI
ncbi:MAG: CoA transferase [Gammaproteobacteria bacterium]|nr:MAG: CoA transferase [Gammaproteobacteria bacterium]